jgi:two-component system response regulator
VTDTMEPDINICLVEDNDDDVFLIRKAVAQTPWRASIHTAVHGEAVLSDLLQRCNTGEPLPGLIFLDINMPRLDGFQVLRALKENPSLRHLPVLVLTTSNRREDVMRAFSLGASSFFTKPPEFEELVSLMDRVLAYWCGLTALPAGGESRCVFRQ